MIQETRRSVAGIVSRDEKILVARRLPGGAIGGKWEFPGGKVEKGESDEEALIREFQEELSVRVRIGPLLAQTRFVHADKEVSLSAYSVYLESEKLELREHSELSWLAADAFPSLDLVQSDRSLLGLLGLE
ncbi:8-oxo-dGTP diphosphatase MutT [Treponema sp.]